MSMFPILKILRDLEEDELDIIKQNNIQLSQELTARGIKTISAQQVQEYVNSNIHNCEHCGNPIDYDITDWCDKCNTSIFDDKKCPQCKEDKLKIHKGVAPWDDVEYWVCPSCDSTFAL